MRGARSVLAALLLSPWVAAAQVCTGDELDTFVNPQRGRIVVAPDRSAATWSLGADVARYRLDPPSPGVPAFEAVPLDGGTGPLLALFGSLESGGALLVWDHSAFYQACRGFAFPEPVPEG